MIWAYRAIFWVPFVVTVFILVTLLLTEARGKLQLKTVKTATFVLVLTFLLQFLGKVTYFYFAVRSSALGKYLLAQPDYWKNNIYYIGHSLIQNILAGLILTILGVLLYKLSKRPLLEKKDLWVLFLTSFVAGYPGILIMLAVAFILMIIFMLFYAIKDRQVNARLDIAPFLLFGALTVGILSSFQFYINFLRAINLI